MYVLKDFVQNLIVFLIDKPDLNSNLIKFRSKQLSELGDFGFSLQSVHRLLLENKCVLSKVALDHISLEDFEKLLIQESKKWSLKVCKCTCINNNIYGSFDKPSAFFVIIKQVLDCTSNYGCHSLYSNSKFLFEMPFDSANIKEKQLNELRMYVFRNVLDNILRFKEHSAGSVETENLVKVKFVFNKLRTDSDVTLFCGPVRNEKDSKKISITTEEFYRKRTIDMRLMAEHKYGLRVTSQSGWQEFFSKLGEAAVIIELLQNKISQATAINVTDHTNSSSKGASFILYNCARLSTLFKEFKKRESGNIYPSLPPLAEIDFNLLVEAEEWELLHCYVSQFPNTVEGCVKDLQDGHVNIHHLCSFLSKMCATFSVYYRRVRILTEPRNHLFPVLHARLYLLKAVEQVLHNGLALLGIQPVKQM